MTKIKEKIKIEKLIKKLKDCDATAQRELYDKLVLNMYNTVFRILKNKEDVQDCLLISFSLLFRKIDQYDPIKGAFSTWYTRIFINESLRILRQKRIRFKELDDSVYVKSNEISPIESLNANDILDIIEMLPDQMRVIFNLYEIEGYSHKEIAASLNIAESSSRTYLTRAKMKLRLIIEPPILEVNQPNTASSKFKRSEE